jgi:uncharacterized protein YhbP (UPF0306 family)
MDKRISRFMEKQTCAGICCTDETGKPYCFSCFYACNPEQGLIYYKSSASTRHSYLLAGNPVVAGTIQPDKLNKLIVKGIQFEGIVLPEDDPACQQSAIEYYRKYPMAIAVPGEIRTIKITSVKMTDSAMGFGKKIYWKRNETVAHS